MSDDSKTYTNVSRERLQRLRTQIGAFVTLPEGDSGAVEGQGVKGRYDYDEAAQALTLSLDEVPMFIPRAMIWSTIDRALS